MAVFSGGCPPNPTPGRNVSPAVAADQKRTYDEAVTGLFISLADFEDDADGRRGSRQVDWFRIENPGRRDSLRFVVNRTRTGAGAMRADLSPGATVVLHGPGVSDFSAYTLLSMAIHSETLRDDLRIALVTDRGRWQSSGSLLRPGWNTVHIDLHRLARHQEVDLRGVRRIELTLPRLASEVTLHLDDILLIDNAREITPSPSGADLRRVGLDYRIRAPWLARELLFRQDDDGLWRLGMDQPLLQLFAAEQQTVARGEWLEVLGKRAVGEIKLLEHNPVRLRLASTWYFPSRAGEWASMGVRRVRWEHTFYPDGRWVVDLLVNNAGGERISAVRVDARRPAVWSDGHLGRTLLEEDFTGPIGRWSYQTTGLASDVADPQAEYLHPGRLEGDIVGEGLSADGDRDRDGFDESQGCYFVRSRNGLCRFRFIPPRQGSRGPVFRVAGPWKGEVTVNSEGRSIRTVARTGEGEVVFALQGLHSRPVWVEVRGRQAVSRRPESFGRKVFLCTADDLRVDGVRSSTTQLRPRAAGTSSANAPKVLYPIKMENRSSDVGRVRSFAPPEGM